ncbi:MAG: glycoside hydrolase family 2 [Bacteroides sp.]|nr:glycoside hydrolase family 2 [Bacteroides sp.]MCM1095563.1 hypothetical protein [Terasakiella sp.]
MNMFFKPIIGCTMAVLPLTAVANGNEHYYNDFSLPVKDMTTVGRGLSVIEDGVYKSKDAYSTFGNPQLRDYEYSFKARSIKSDRPVQIWTGFRAANHHDRYMLGLRGGLQDDLILMRLGYLGTEEFLAERPLRFHPEPGEWYDIRVQVCGNRIRVFVGDQPTPYIDLEDKNAYLIPSGNVLLGGGWVDTEFDDLKIAPLAAGALDGVKKQELGRSMTKAQREEKRKAERASYKAINVPAVRDIRTDISLDGDWLFLPDYEQQDLNGAIAQDADDSRWHVMQVPSFWNPSRIWLHGETMPTPNGPESKGVSDRYYRSETERCENYSFDFRRIKHAWYRQIVNLPENIQGKHIELTFDAVSRVADVYINGAKAGQHIGMFGDFKIDATKYLHPGRNVIAVRVTGKADGKNTDTGSDAIDFFYASVRESEQDGGKVDLNEGEKPKAVNLVRDLPHGFWGSEPAGIWQPVTLTITNPLKVDEVFIKPSLTGATFDLTVKNNDSKKKTYNLYTDIIDKATGEALYTGLSKAALSIGGGEKSTVSYSIDRLSPKLWSPTSPNLYDFRFRLTDSKGKEVDCMTETSGFRTFEVKDGHFYLNGRKYWMRGANHTPFALEPNSREAADKFMGLLADANIELTRTHNTPWNKLWMEAADRNGLGVSFEGTWSWLMIHSTPIPNKILLDFWADEWIELLRKYRNHPSLLLWTVNNEMKFYDNDENLERTKEKMRIISEVVKRMRAIDPTRPICFDSNYQAKGKSEKFGAAFMDSIDDGDIDDMHAYYNWYDYSMFKFFNGEFSQRYKMPDRPLISQEFSTGYINGETGHPVRSYQMIHENPLQLIGYDCYDFSDPDNFLKVQSFITGELVEATRRSNPDASGIMHFGLLTWFRQPYDHTKITPWPTYYALQRGSQPVLVTAELWGRNLYGGDKLNTRIYVVNDAIDGHDLKNPRLDWLITASDGKILATGSRDYPDVPYYGRVYIEPDIQLPEVAGKQTVRLALKLSENGTTVSENEYDLLVAPKDWNKLGSGIKIALLDHTGIDKQLDFIGAGYTKADGVARLLKSGKDALKIISGEADLTDGELAQLRKYISEGGRLLVTNAPRLSQRLFPEYISGTVDTWQMADIAFMERNDYPVFDNIEPLELRYFNNGRREIPVVCTDVFNVKRHENLKELIGHMRVHGYCDFKTPEQHQQRVSEFRGFPLFEITEGKGKAIVSGMSFDKTATDPIAGRLFINTIAALAR